MHPDPPPSPTPPHPQFYQHLFTVADVDVVRLLRMLTFLDLGEVERLQAHMAEPGWVGRREGRKRVAAAAAQIEHPASGPTRSTQTRAY